MARMDPRPKEEVPELAGVLAAAEANPAEFPNQALSALDWQLGKHA